MRPRYVCCEHCRWTTVPQPHHHMDPCTQPRCPGTKREAWQPDITTAAPVADNAPMESAPAPTQGKEIPVAKDMTRYNEREVEVTRDDDKVFVGKAVVDEAKAVVRLMTGKRGRPPVVPFDHIKKIKLAA